jgi:RNA polymerase sigma factor (sigma-70 family)
VTPGTGPQIDWRRLAGELLLWSAAQLPRRYWRGERGGTPPGALMAQDLVQSAFVRAFERREAWNDQTSLEELLRNYILHRISRWSRRRENRDKRIDTIIEHEVASTSVLTGFGTGSPLPNALQDQEQTIYDSQIVTRFRKLLGSDRKGQAVFDAICDGEAAPRKIAAELGMTIPEVDAAKRRIRRKLSQYAGDLVHKQDPLVKTAESERATHNG